MAYRQTDYTRKKTQASRRGLLLAALKLFTNRGYRSTSMQQVVKAAGTSIGNANDPASVFVWLEKEQERKKL